MAINPIKTPQEMLLQSAGIPALASGGKPPTKAQMQAAIASNALKGGMPSTRYKPENPIIGYRAAFNPKHADKNGMETLPTTFDKDKITKYVNAYADAKDQFGLPALTPQDLLNQLLVEGRSDFGFNSLDKNDKQANKIAGQLVDWGHEDLPAGFAGAIYNKQRIANAHNVPYYVAWNGEGRNKDTGLTGWDYNDRINQSRFAVEDPRNKPLLDHISTLMQPPQASDADPNAMNATNLLGNTNMPQPTVGSAMFKKGGKVKPFRDMSKVLIQKHLGK